MTVWRAIWEDSSEQRWTAPCKFVCEDCVEDEHLREMIWMYESTKRVCDYCGRERAGPVSAILGPIGEALHRYFADPRCAGVIRDEGEWLIDTMATEEALRALSLSLPPDLLGDVARAFHNKDWVPCNGNFLAKHEGTRMMQVWDHFEEMAKHRTRYFLDQKADRIVVDPWTEYRSPTAFLHRIGEVVTDLHLVRPLDEQQVLFRARHEKVGEVFATIKDLGAPPNAKAAAGRMNAAGIAYLYLAKELDTAVGEVTETPARVAVGEFRLKSRIAVLDLTDVPEPPSVFDVEEYHKRQAILFLNNFIERISITVKKDGREHVEFVPSQVVSEFFAQVFSLESTRQGIDGIVYQSVVKPDGQNVVIFPPKKGGAWEDIIELVTTDHWVVDTELRLTRTGQI